jgi:hypothetical protein
VFIKLTSEPHGVFQTIFSGLRPPHEAWRDQICRPSDRRRKLRNGYKRFLELYAALLNYRTAGFQKEGSPIWAQVNGHRGETDTLEKMQRRVEHDLYYIDNWSLLLDFKIILLTLFSKRAYTNAY